MKGQTILVFSVLIGLVIISNGCMVSSKTPNSQVTMIIRPSVPPPVFNSRPALVVIDTTPDIYYVNGVPDVFFYSSSWYYYCEDRWFVSSSHNGPWVFIETHRLPARMGHIPPGHLRTPPGHQVKPKPTPPGHIKDKDNEKNKDKGKRKDKGNDDDNQPRRKKK